MSEWLGSDGLYSVAVLQCGTPVQQPLGVEPNILAAAQITTSNWEGILPLETPEPRGPEQGSGPDFDADDGSPERRPALDFVAEEQNVEETAGADDERTGISGGPPGGPFGPGRVRPVVADTGEPYQQPQEADARPAPTRPQQPFATAAAPRLLTVKKSLLFILGVSFAAFL